jgi:hypothetical protein
MTRQGLPSREPIRSDRVPRAPADKATRRGTLPGSCDNEPQPGLGVFPFDELSSGGVAPPRKQEGQASRSSAGQTAPLRPQRAPRSDPQDSSFSRIAIASGRLGIREAQRLRLRAQIWAQHEVRFPAPVPISSKVRADPKVEEVQDIAGGAQEVFEVSSERERTKKPVCVAETVVRVYTC